ncbi:MAG: hypothetical protein AAF431_16915 [Pseudomonadota bacterium]
MSSTAIIAVRAAIRIGSTAVDAFNQYAQEKPILLPDAERVTTSLRDFIAQKALDFPEFGTLLQDDPELSELWVNNRPRDDEAAVVLEAIAYQYVRAAAQEEAGVESSNEVAYGVMVTQWAVGKGPVSPLARVIVAMTDVALEYISGNPQVLGIGGEGEKLVGAIAGSLSKAIPDAASRTELGPKDRFSERLAGLTLHAGLKALSENASLVFDEEHLEVLLQNTLTPIVNALDTDSIADQVEWRKVTDALLGPAINTVLSSVAQTPDAFLGSKFNSERAGGIMVSALLKAATENGIKDVFTEAGLLNLGRAAISAAADSPEAILGDLLNTDLTTDISAKEEVALNIFKSIAGVLSNRMPPYKDQLGVAIAVAAVDGLKQSARVLINSGGDWNGVIAQVTEQILDGFKAAFGNEAASLSDTVFSEAKLVEIGKVIVEQIGRTPHILVGDKDEVGRIVSALSKAILADQKLLLTAEDWKQIVAVAAQEAAQNPGRLFGLNQSSISILRTSTPTAIVKRC